MDFKDLDSAMSLARILVKPAAPTPKHVPKITPPPINRRRELIAGGDIRWKPVDKAAAMLLTKAQDINKPHHESNQNRQANTDKASIQGRNGEKTMERSVHRIERFMAKSQPVQARGRTNGLRCTQQNNGREKTQTDKKMSKIFIPSADNNPGALASLTLSDATEKLRDLTRLESQLQEVGAALRSTLEGVREIYGEVNEFTSEATKSTRATRMAAVIELNQFAGALREVRKFFLGAEYEQETKRLQEFVELCERLNALKESGFLDQVADTMLRMAEVK